MMQKRNHSTVWWPYGDLAHFQASSVKQHVKHWAFGITRACATRIKFSKLLFSIKIDDTESPYHLSRHCFVRVSHFSTFFFFHYCHNSRDCLFSMAVKTSRIFWLTLVRNREELTATSITSSEMTQKYTISRIAYKFKYHISRKDYRPLLN